jgi:hypothetical protein
MSLTLYDTDYNQWIEQTAQQLRERRLEHLLKLSYWESEKERAGNHWASEIVNFRYQIDKRLKDSPSLNPAIESMYAEIFPIALKSVSKLFPLPSDAMISLSQALDDNWFPEASQSEEQ